MNSPLYRRTFLKQSALAGAALTMAPILSRIARAQVVPNIGGRSATHPQWTNGDWRQPSRALRGVNLGAWLVLEKWMTPSLFQGVEASDEWGFSQTPGAREKLEKHRQTFITERDFEWIKSHGLDAVRLPIGYWTLEESAPYIAGAAHVDNAMRWARNHDLQVLIDLHGAPGSQNGMDHSGRSGEIGWTKPENIEATVRSLEVIARALRQSSEFVGHRMSQRAALGRFARYAQSVLWGGLSARARAFARRESVRDARRISAFQLERFHGRPGV